MSDRLLTYDELTMPLTEQDKDILSHFVEDENMWSNAVGELDLLSNLENQGLIVVDRSYKFGSLSKPLNCAVTYKGHLIYKELKQCQYGKDWPCNLAGTTHSQCDYTGKVTPKTVLLKG